jgi:DNA repair protein RadC
MLDTKGRLIADEIISIGTVDRTLASPRDIFLKALSHRAVTIVLLHNHPSGNPEPSEADLLLTRQVRECGEMIGIPLVDHIIIGDRRSVSFALERLL